MRLFPLCFAVLSLSVLAADIDQSEYLSYNLGDEWIMDVVLTKPTGQTVKATTRIKVEDTVAKNGLNYVRCRQLFEWSAGGEAMKARTELVRKDGSALFSLQEDKIDNKEQAEIVLPMRPGKSWKFEDHGKSITASVIGIENVTIVDKTYMKCFHMRNEADDGSFREDYWEAPKSGRVKTVVDYGKNGKMIMTLREFKPGKQ